MVSAYRADVSALLIAGNEVHHKPQLNRFREYLVAYAQVSPKRIKSLSGRKNTNRDILEQTEEFIAAARAFRDKQGSGFLVVAYHGHGIQEGFCPDGTPASYYNLVDAIGFDMSFLFINSCCYAGAAVDVFRECGLIPSFGSVIASSRSYKPSYGAIFLEQIVDSWKQRKEFRRKKMYIAVRDEAIATDPDSFSPLKIYTQMPTRSGISLDHILYARD